MLTICWMDGPDSWNWILWNSYTTQNYSICLSDVWRNRLILYSIKWLNWDLCLVARFPSFFFKKLLNFHFILLYMKIGFVSNFLRDNWFTFFRLVWLYWIGGIMNSSYFVNTSSSIVNPGKYSNSKFKITIISTYLSLVFHMDGTHYYSIWLVLYLYFTSKTRAKTYFCSTSITYGRLVCPTDRLSIYYTLLRSWVEQGTKYIVNGIIGFCCLAISQGTEKEQICWIW